VKLSIDSRLLRAGYRKSRIIIFSVMHERTGVMEIGRKSLSCVGPDVFGTGQILACFHCIGTADVLIDRLIRSARVLQNTGAPSRKNQAGKPSRPVDVDLRLSKISNIR